MKNVPDTKYIYHQKSTGHYQIHKKIKGKTVSFGNYDTLEEALFVRDYFQEHNWDTRDRLRFTKTSFITRLPSGKYSVIKQGKGTKESYGTFDTLSEAEYQVRLCKRFNWDKRLKPFDCMKHIWLRKDAKTTTYRIVREEDGKLVFYGTFHNLDDAKFERDILLACNWDIELACEYDEREDNTTIWLDGKYAKGNPLYQPANGRIDYDKELIPNKGEC